MSDNWNDAAERTYTPARQVETDQHCREVCGCEGSKDHTPPTALDYCNGEMANCLKVTDEQAARIRELETLSDTRRMLLEGMNGLAAELRVRVDELEATPLAEDFFRAQSEVARLTAQVAELGRENGVLNRLMHATRDLDTCGIRATKGRCQGCDAHYARAVAAVIEEWPALHNGWVAALTEAGFPWTQGAAEAGGEA